MSIDGQSDDAIRAILTSTRRIALVGASAKPWRASHGVMRFLLDRGFDVTPVNPGLAGGELLGQKVYGKLADIPDAVDMVDIFRNSKYALAIVTEALAMSPRPQVIWMQLGVYNEEAAKLAEDAGLKVVMNRCPKIEYGRLSSEIAWMGVNTRTLTSKKAKILGGGIQRMSLDRNTMSGGSTTAADKAFTDNEGGGGTQ